MSTATAAPRRLGVRTRRATLVVSPALLLVAMTLSVVKPWGRLRRRAGSGG